MLSRANTVLTVLTKYIINKYY